MGNVILVKSSICDTWSQAAITYFFKDRISSLPPIKRDYAFVYAASMDKLNLTNPTVAKEVEEFYITLERNMGPIESCVVTGSLTSCSMAERLIAAYINSGPVVYLGGYP